jgi:diadenylate cyclase
VVFQPELRRALEQLGRAEIFSGRSTDKIPEIEKHIDEVVEAAAYLAKDKIGALMIWQRETGLKDFMDIGIDMDAVISRDLLINIFTPNTPLHDGAVIISNNLIVAASCVMPLSASGILNRTPDRQMGLRHRAALGISEASDAVAVVVSEETGSISIAHGGRMIRRLDSERLENILIAFYRPEGAAPQTTGWLKRVLRVPSIRQPED